MAATPSAGRALKHTKKQVGRARQQGTPVAVRTAVELPAGAEDWVRTQLGRKLDDSATLIERGTVRFFDVNGPRGGADIVCRIKLVVSGRPSIVAEARATDPRTAFQRALPTVARAMRRTRDKHGLRGVPRTGATPPPARQRESVDEGEIIGRRVGRGPAALASALSRPEKTRRDAYVDTAQSGVSASDRRAGGDMSARRNSRARARKATAALEDSRTRPSRKSTRRSANRGKPSQTKERTVASQAWTPSARAARGRAAR